MQLRSRVRTTSHVMLLIGNRRQDFQVLMKKTTRLWLAALGVAASVLLALMAHVAWRISQNESGLCVAANKVLGEEELARLVARNLLLMEVRNANRHEAAFRNGLLRVGLIRNVDKPDVRAIVQASFGSEKSFEENFSIQPIAPAKVEFDVRSVGGPFTVVTYDALRGGGATFASTVDIRRAPDFAPQDSDKEPSLLEKYDGFGNRYYRMVVNFIARECCDNKSYRASREEYMNRKTEAYKSTMQSFKRGIAVGEIFVSVSNCGDILTDESEVGAGLRTIRQIFKKKVNHDNANN